MCLFERRRDCSTPGTVVTVSVANGGRGHELRRRQRDGAGRPRAVVCNYNGTAWNSFSSSTNNELINGTIDGDRHNASRYGCHEAFHAFVGGGACPTKSYGGPLQASVHVAIGSRGIQHGADSVLLSDDPNDLPGGASDSNNIRLAKYRKLGGHGYNCLMESQRQRLRLEPRFCRSASGAPTTCTSPRRRMRFQRHVYIDLQREFPNNPTVVCPADWPFRPRVDKYGEQPSPLLVPNGSPYIYGSDAAIRAPLRSLRRSLPAPVRSSATFTPCPTPTMNYSGTNYAPLAAAVSSVCPTSPYNSAVRITT